MHRERIVLIVDIWHPDLTPSERWALDRVVRVSPRARAYARSAAAVTRRASSS